MPTIASHPAATTTAPPRKSWLDRLRRLRAARKDPARLGDAALLQSDLLGLRMSPGASARVRELVARHGLAALRPRFDEIALQRLPRGTFGREFVEFCAANNITPVTISDAIADDELLHRAAVARYIVTHDMFHVLLGLDTSFPGELGVTGFVLGQRYIRGAWLLFAIQCVVVSLLRPHQALRIAADLRAGYRLGRRAPMLLAEPLETFFADDLEQLRRRLGLRPNPMID